MNRRVPDTPAIEQALIVAARTDAPKVLSVLVARFGDLDLVDDAVQDALIDAGRSWSRDGIPDNVGGWLMTVARRRVLDRLKAQRRERERMDGIGAELMERSMPADSVNGDLIADSPPSATPPDERLRLLLLCCHPSLHPDAQVALTLRLVGGLSTAEIGAAFLVPEATLAQRIVRAKRKIRMANIPLSVPDELTDRMDVVLSVLYLVFNEGYLSHRSDGHAIRVDLVDEAIRLTRLVIDLAPSVAEAHGLLALELFHRARSAGRLDQGGELVLLEDQDRSCWDRGEIDEANGHLAAAMNLMEPGTFQLQALIAAQHANARTAEDTDWPAIVTMYGQLEAMTASPVVSLNAAVARAMADGPLAGLAHLDGVDGLDDYHLYWATRGELHRRAARLSEARQDLQRALALATNESERRLIDRRLAACDETPTT